MFICHNQQFVYVSFTKSGSSSMYKLLETNFSGQRMKRTQKHVPEQYKDYVSFTVVRSPYSRLVSWWWSICKVDGDRYGHKKELAERGLSQSLEDFVVLWSEKKGTTQHVAIERHRYNHILKLENLERDLHALSFMPEHIIIPRANKKNYPHWRELMTPEAGQVINSIYKHEFDSLGYEMENF